VYTKSYTGTPEQRTENIKMTVYPIVPTVLFLFWVADAFSCGPQHIKKPLLGPKVVREPAIYRPPLVPDNLAFPPDQRRLVQSYRQQSSPRCAAWRLAMATIYFELHYWKNKFLWRAVGIAAAHQKRLDMVVFRTRQLLKAVLRWASSAQRGLGRRAATGALLVALTFPTLAVVQPARADSYYEVKSAIEIARSEAHNGLQEVSNGIQSVRNDIQALKNKVIWAPCLYTNIGFAFAYFYRGSTKSDKNNKKFDEVDKNG
jgi:hypothetical protein